MLLNYPVWGAFDEGRLGDDSLIVSVGVNNIRKRIVDKLPPEIDYERAIHPSAPWFRVTLRWGTGR